MLFLFKIINFPTFFVTGFIGLGYLITIYTFYRTTFLNDVLMSDYISAARRQMIKIIVCRPMVLNTAILTGICVNLFEEIPRLCCHIRDVSAVLCFGLLQVIGNKDVDNNVNSANN